MSRVKAVEREHKATRLATERLLTIASQDPTALSRDIRFRDLQEAANQLEGTYIIRLFAEFETCLRSAFFAMRNRRAPSRTRDLLDSVGARRTIPHDQINAAHAVREYRNRLVHERDDEVAAIPIDAARSHLCYYLNFLPPQW